MDLGNIQLSFLSDAFVYGTGPKHTQNTGIALFAVDDNSVAYFSDQGSTQPFCCFDVYVFDISGARTWYCAAGAYTSVGYITSILPLGKGNFLVSLSNGKTYNFGVRNQKLNNASPILLSATANGFQNTCYDSGATHSVYYDGLHNLIAVSWVQAVGQNGSEIYSSVYQVSENGELTRTVDGWTCYTCPSCVPAVPGNPIIYDQTAAGSSDPIGTAGSMSNGISAAVVNVGITGALGVSRESYIVNAGRTGASCTDSNQNFVTTAVNDTFIVEGGFPGPFSSYWLLDTNINGLAGMCFNYQNPDAGSLAIMGDNDVVFTANLLQPSGYNSCYAGGAVITNKNLFLMSSNRDGLYTAPLSGVFNGYNANRRGLALINGTRPISVTGKYKA
jgi:hypothetical protein